ncbi:unnamed protein product [Urochloa humidicola]
MSTARRLRPPLGRSGNCAGDSFGGIREAIWTIILQILSSFFKNLSRLQPCEYGMRMTPCCSEFRFRRRIFACIISQLREGDYRNGAKVTFRCLHSGLKRIIHENSR